jgi:phosphoribosylformylglycinamidine cyclo-ligase
LQASGVPAWVLGRVTHDDDAHQAHRLVRGTKGVHGGAVLVEGDHPTA